MRRWISHLFIVGYLGALFAGVGMHAMRFRHDAHPIMYYYVWDMFCGWSAFEQRNHLIAEGESGTYYQLSPGPWGDFKPYGDLTRNHYDYFGNALPGMAMNALRHTEHEPIQRILFVEENWPKKYNLPDSLWSLMFFEDKDPKSYFWVRSVHSPDGQMVENRGTFLSQLFSQAVLNNPRLQADSKSSRPVFAINPYDRRIQQDATGAAALPAYSPESSPSAN